MSDDLVSKNVIVVRGELCQARQKATSQGREEMLVPKEGFFWS